MYFTSSTLTIDVGKYLTKDTSSPYIDTKFYIKLDDQ